MSGYSVLKPYIAVYCGVRYTERWHSLVYYIEKLFVTCSPRIFCVQVDLYILYMCTTTKGYSCHPSTSTVRSAVGVVVYIIDENTTQPKRNTLSSTTRSRALWKRQQQQCVLSVCIRPIVIERCSFYVQEFYIQKELCGWVSSGVCVCSSPEMGCTYRRGSLGYGEAYCTRTRSLPMPRNRFMCLCYLA